MMAALQKHKPDFDLSRICFKEQLDFILDKSPWVTASCSRRAGKTEVCAIDLLNTATQHKGINCLYITLTRANAAKLVWKKVLEYNEIYRLGGVVNISALSLSFANGSTIYFSGCKDKSELDKFRGLALKLIYIDEVQSFKSFIEELIDEVLAPTLADYAGSLKLLGTPAPLQSGYFWKTLQAKAYAHHAWTFWNNPFIARKSGLTHREILDRELGRRGVDESHPSIRREWFGEWTTDSDALVLKYNEIKNHYDEIPPLTDYIIAVDVGYEDADAIAVIGWHHHKQICYLVKEVVEKKQGITDLAQQIERLIKVYSPLKVVMDTGGLGKKIAEELRKRYSLPIMAAEKSRKIEYLALLNDALLTQRFMAKKDSQFARDSMLVEWDYDKSTSDKLVIKDEPHSDIVDSVLYGFREALHWLSEAPKAPVRITRQEQWIKHSEKLMEDALEREILIQKADENESDYFALAHQDLDTNPLQHFLDKRKTR